MNTRTWVLFGIVCGCLAFSGPALCAADAPAADLLAGLKSPDEAVRLQSIHQLGTPGAEAAVAPLTELLKDNSARVRTRMPRALRIIGGAAKSAVPALVELAKDPNEKVRRQAVKAVAAIRPGPQVTVPLCIKLLEDSDLGVRLRAERAYRRRR